MQTVTVKRLTKLRDFLKTVPETRFDITQWATDGFFYDNKPSTARGMAACAGGWACTIPSFRKAGLRPCSYYDGMPVFEDYAGLDALSYFFGLDNLNLPEQLHCVENSIHSAASYIFDGRNKNSVKDAVRRIDNVLKLADLERQIASIK
jgi:hypothetical protein